MLKRVLRTAGFALVGILLLLQFIPSGRGRGNPPVSAEPAWDSPQTRDLVKRACFDCHSNETVWPWYSHVAPVSWLVQKDVEQGRGKLNFSEWDRPQDEAHEAADEVRRDKMPLWFYLPLHPDARLSTTEKAALIRGLEATIGTERHREQEKAHGDL